MAMTEEEKREARREASRKWYAAHKANKNTTRRPRKRGKAKIDHPMPDEEQILDDNKTISVDPSLLTGIEDKTVSVPSPCCDVNNDKYDEDDDIDDKARLAELEEIDPDELTDAERDELEELREDLEDDDWYSGRSESLRELEEQGAYDD